MDSSHLPTYLSAPPKFSLFVAVVFLALQATPAAPADSAGSGTYVKGGKHTVTFKDVYAFHDETTQVTLVYFSESQLDKKAMTVELRKKRDEDAIKKYFDKAYARLRIDRNGKVVEIDLVSPGYSLSRSLLRGETEVGKSDVKLNTAKRVEGRFSYDETSLGESRKIDLRFATDLADVGPPVKK